MPKCPSSFSDWFADAGLAHERTPASLHGTGRDRPALFPKQRRNTGSHLRTKAVWPMPFPILPLEPEVHVRRRPSPEHSCSWIVNGSVANTWAQRAVARPATGARGAIHYTHFEKENLRRFPSSRAIHPLKNPSQPPYPRKMSWAGVFRGSDHGRALSIDSYTSSVFCATTRGAYWASAFARAVTPRRSRISASASSLQSASASSSLRRA